MIYHFYIKTDNYEYPCKTYRSAVRLFNILIKFGLKPRIVIKF